MFKSGFVSLIGRPNVGKSTLANRVIGEKISIMSDKPQTTRNKIQLVYTDEESQIVFLDTPGVQMPKNKLGDYMLKLSKSSLNEVDLVVFVVDTSEKTGKLDNYIINQLKEIESKIILLINKIDLIEKDQLLELVVKYDKMDMFEEIVPVSALEGENINTFIEVLKSHMEEGPKYFPDDMITDQPERFIISELIREKALHNLEEEIPHGIYVGIDEISKREDRDLIDVFATIYCEKESHKAIIIGKKGNKIKDIGTSARQDIENLLGSKVNLQLWVKVEKNWREKEARIREFGYENEL